MGSDKLVLQREILAAVGDEEKMAALAERHGIDRDLWLYLQAMMRAVDSLAEVEGALSAAIQRAAKTPAQ